MFLYRIAKTQYISDLSGNGAKEHGGRWNSVGSPMLYTSETISLCLLEVLCNIPLEFVQNNLSLITLKCDDDILIESLTLNDLPANWIEYPSPKYLQQLGDAFLKKQKHIALKVPSAIVLEEYNVLFNPLHKDFNKIKIESNKKYVLDNRLYNKLPII